MTPKRFRSLRTIDPACGSGIFLRTLLELQCNPTIPGTTHTTIKDAFQRTEGLDRDPNACAATRLSLALLHLVATDELPANLPIKAVDAISEANTHQIEANSYGAVLTNPPYIKYEHLNPQDRELYSAYLGSAFGGRIDAYIAFLKLALDAVEPDGFVCMVLPQVFLNADNALPIRSIISERFDVRCLVDLSAVDVFDGVGAYSILLIVQKRLDPLKISSQAQVAHVTEFVGSALQACLDGATVDSPFYRVFSVNQSFFKRREWIVVSPEQMSIDEKLKGLPTLSSYMNVLQGVVTGADDVFMIPRTNIPKGEEAVYINYLPDRQIAKFSLPVRSDQVIFYPFENFHPLSEEDLQDRFPKTWEYLELNRARLEDRGPVRAGHTAWWRPERPRNPQRIKGAKIVCPHLMLTPRFAVDWKGSFTVSRSPFIVPKGQNDDTQLLKLFVGILNSSVCNWFLRTYAPKYARGYSRVETNLLKRIPIPNLAKIDVADTNRIIDAVDKIQSGRASEGLEAELDILIAEAYGFNQSERKILLGIQ